MQLFRKPTSVEGTHGIQALDLLGRKIRGDDGRAFAVTLQRMRQAVALGTACGEEIATLAGDVGRAIDFMERITAQAEVAADTSFVLGHATSYLRTFGHVVLGWVWLELAVAAVRAREKGSRTKEFFDGKLACARYFITHEIPVAIQWVGPLSRGDRLWDELPPHAL